MMTPEESNHTLAALTLDNLLKRIPDVPGLRALSARLFIAVIDDRIRMATM